MESDWRREAAEVGNNERQENQGKNGSGSSDSSCHLYAIEGGLNTEFYQQDTE